MQIELKPKSSHHIKPQRILQQTSFWARLKEQQGWKPKAFDLKVKELFTNSDAVNNDLLIVIHPLNDEYTMAYIPYGPGISPPEEDRGTFLEELSESLRSYLPSDCLFIRYDLAWESPWINDPNRYSEMGNWLGLPDSRTREMRMNIGTENWLLRKAPTEVLPSNTIFIDLKNSQEKLIRNMKPKTRYNTRLAGRRGVKVREAGLRDLAVWYDLYLETSLRNRIIYNDINYFRAVMEAGRNNSSGATISLMMAEYEGKPLAGLFLATAAGRATYLFGASTSSYRNMMGTYALQWNAILKAKEEGCHEYDLFGVAPVADPSHPMYGLYRFKTGFGGKLFHRQGCWDYVFNESEYERYRASELKAPGYHVKAG